MAIDKDIKCRNCGYNLRGLAEKGVCPECAAPIAQSARVTWKPAYTYVLRGWGTLIFALFALHIVLSTQSLISFPLPIELFCGFWGMAHMFSWTWVAFGYLEKGVPTECWFIMGMSIILSGLSCFLGWIVVGMGSM